MIAKLDAAVVAMHGPGYTATTCPVSGQPLGSMGDPKELVFDGRLVRLCCANCVAEFYADPIAAMARLDSPPGGSRVAHGEGEG